LHLDTIVEARIHPGIGIARVGDSDEYFIGPEAPCPTAPPEGGYRDPQGRLKRQAARFRIYGYDSAGEVVAELTSANAEIKWKVHIANKKGAWYNFDFALDLPEAANESSSRRNADIQGKAREELIIDPKPREISGRNQRSRPFDNGTFLGAAVYLGELRTDDEGRLIFLGGRGKSASPLGYTLTTFANNPGWHDDTSDGPVSATVKIGGGRSIPVDPAWVATGPPNYSPDIVTPQTMYDVVRDAISNLLIPKPVRPSFRNDILPLLRQCVDAQWVNAGFLALFGWKGPYEFLRSDYLMKLAAAPANDDPFKELRRQVYYSFRNPGGSTFDPLQWPPLYGDAFGSFDTPPGPREGFAVTATLFRFLGQWAGGDFDADYDVTVEDPRSLDDLPEPARPAALDRAALHFCMGGPFHPGCEMTWPMRRSSMYRAPFRLRERVGGHLNLDYGEYLTPTTVLAFDGPLSASSPGDITKWMAVPWQSDTDSCRAGYPGTPFPQDEFIPAFWPSRVPNNILTEDNYRIVMDKSQPIEKRFEAFHSRPYWLRNLRFKDPKIAQLDAMVHRFGELGLVERREQDAGPDFPAVMYVETLPPQAAAPSMTLTAAVQEAPPLGPSVSEEFALERFPRLRR
jgi:L-Lysine epsilon oxidase N-terminal/L-lysine epsilon oxidase C-terminal domain